MSNPNQLRRGRAALGAAVVTALAVVLAGCSGSGGDSTAGGGPLTIVGTSGSAILADFNPFQMSTGGAAGPTALFYLPLESYNTVNSKYTQHLATGHTIVSPEEVDFTLRSGVKWSDGTPVTAQDVIFTFNMLKKSPGLDTGGVWQSLASVTSSGDKVVFALKKPNSQLTPNLATVPIVPEGVWSKVSNPVTYTNASPKVVDGPYKLDSVSTVKVTAVPNPKYYAAASMKDAPQTVVGLPEEPSNQIADLQHGSFDLYQINDSDRGGFKKDYVDKDPAHNHSVMVPSASETTLFMNLAKAPFNDVALRQAINLAINRDQLALRANINGYEPAISQTGILPSQKSLIPSSIPNGGMVKQDLTKAKNILTTNGYRYSGSNLIGPDGKQVSFAIQTVQGFTDWTGVAQGLQSQLKELGINASVTQLQLNTAVSNLFSGQYDTAIWITGNQSTPYANFQSVLDSRLTAPIGTSAAGNYGRLKDPSVDALIDKVAASADTDTQNTALGQLATYMYEQVPVLDLVGQWNSWTYSTKHYTGWPTSSNMYANPTGTGVLLDVIPQLKKSNG